MSNHESVERIATRLFAYGSSIVKTQITGKVTEILVG